MQRDQGIRNDPAGAASEGAGDIEVTRLVNNTESEHGADEMQGTILRLPKLPRARNVASCHDAQPQLQQAPTMASCHTTTGEQYGDSVNVAELIANYERNKRTTTTIGLLLQGLSVTSLMPTSQWMMSRFRLATTECPVTRLQVSLQTSAAHVWTARSLQGKRKYLLRIRRVSQPN